MVWQPCSVHKDENCMIDAEMEVLMDKTFAMFKDDMGFYNAKQEEIILQLENHVAGNKKIKPNIKELQLSVEYTKIELIKRSIIKRKDEIQVMIDKLNANAS